jgi:DNA-binding response OmpR family regulator
MLPADINRQVVCQCCEGTGYVLDHAIEADGFRYLPDFGISYNGRKLPISPKPARVLGALIAAQGRVVSKGGLLGYVYRAEEDEADQKIIDVWVCKLRKVLFDHTGLEPIQTIWGRGYCWQLPDLVTNL